MEQRPLGFRIAEEKRDSFKNQTVLLTSGADGADKPDTKPATKPLKTKITLFRCQVTT